MASLHLEKVNCASGSARQHRLFVGRVGVARPVVQSVPRPKHTEQLEGHNVGANPYAFRGSCISRATYHGSVMAEPGTKYAVVVAKFNSLITKGLLEGAMEVFESHGVPEDHVDVAWVPGSFELPVVAKNMAKSGKYVAVVCIGAIIRGSTSHYDAVVSAATSGVLGAGTDTGVPVIFGVLTTDDLEQALDRTGGKVGNKGGEAALTAVEMASLLSKLKAEGKAA